MADRDGFDRIANFRDFGGEATLHGTRVARHRLFRAAHLADASDSDLQRIAVLGITLIVDLRRPGERQDEPGRITSDTAVTVLTNDLGDDIEAPHIAFLRRGDTSDAAVERFLLEYYGNAPDEPRHRTLFGDTLAAMQTLTGSLLVHCAAGKDRTGILVALIQTLLGVPEAAVMRDYLRTNAVMLTPARIAATTARLHEQTGQAPSEGVVHALLGVRAAYLERAFASIDERHGSLDRYLDGLGIDAVARGRIRDRFTTGQAT